MYRQATKKLNTEAELNLRNHYKILYAYVITQYDLNDVNAGLGDKLQLIKRNTGGCYYN